MTADSRQWFILALAAAFFWLIYLLAILLVPYYVGVRGAMG